MKLALQLVDGNKEAVLFIQLGRSFPAIFSHAVFKSTLPAVFERQNTANLAVNIGRPYMQIPATNATESQKFQIYPAVTLSNYTSGDAPAALMRVAAQISSPPTVWPERASDAPPRMIGSYYRQYTDEVGPNTTIKTYFFGLKEFFANPAQDKLIVALAYFNSQLPVTTDLVASSADANPLDALYDKLQAAVDAGGLVNLIPGI